MNLTPEHLEKLICFEFSVTPEQLKGKCRDKEIVFPRQVFCYIIRDFRPDLSLKFIGKYLNRDHTTVMHSLTSIQDYFDTNPNVTQRIVKFRFKVIQILKESPEYFPVAS